MFFSLCYLLSHLLLVMSQPGSACPQPRVPGLLFWPLGFPEPALSQRWPSSPPHWLSQKRNRVHVQPPILSYFINFGALHWPGGLMVSMLCFIGCSLTSSHELCVQFLMHVYFLWGCNLTFLWGFGYFLLPFGMLFFPYVLLWFLLDIMSSGLIKIALTSH